MKNESIKQNRNEQKVVRKGQRESHRDLGEIDLEWSVLRPILVELKDLLSKRKNLLKLQTTLCPQWRKINLHSTSQQNIQSKIIFFKSVELTVDELFIFRQGVYTVSRQQKTSIKYIKLDESSVHHEKSLKMNSAHQELTGNYEFCTSGHHWIYVIADLSHCVLGPALGAA